MGRAWTYVGVSVDVIFERREAIIHTSSCGVIPGLCQKEHDGSCHAKAKQFEAGQ